MIDTITPLGEKDIDAMREAMLYYETYQEMAEKTGVIEKTGNNVHVEFAFEDHTLL